MKKFDKYWEKGEDGQPLPYLDGYTSRFITDYSVALLEVLGPDNMFDSQTARLETLKMLGVAYKPGQAFLVVRPRGWLVIPVVEPA